MSEETDVYDQCDAVTDAYHDQLRGFLRRLKEIGAPQPKPDTILGIYSTFFGVEGAHITAVTPMPDLRPGMSTHREFPRGEILNLIIEMREMIERADTAHGMTHTGGGMGVGGGDVSFQTRGYDVWISIAVSEIEEDEDPAPTVGSAVTHQDDADTPEIAALASQRGVVVAGQRVHNAMEAIVIFAANIICPAVNPSGMANLLHERLVERLQKMKAMSTPTTESA